MDVNPIISYLFISLLVWNTVWFHQIPQQICHLREEEFPKTASFGSRAQNLQQFSQGQSLSCDFYKGTHLATCNLWFWNIFLWMAPLKKIHQPQVVSAKLTLFCLSLRDFHESSSISIFSPRSVPLHYYFVSKRSPVAHVRTKASIFWHLVLLPSMQWHPADRWAWNRSLEKSTCLNLKGVFFKLWEAWERLWIYWCGFQFVSKHFKGGWIHFTLFISSKWWIQGGFNIEYWCIPPMRICF